MKPAMPLELSSPITFFLLIACVLLLSACSAATPARQVLYVSTGQGQALLAYTINNDTGQLTELQRVDLPGPAGTFALTDDGGHLYAALNNPGRLQALARDTTTGQLTLLEAVEITTFPTYIDIDHTGKFALTASYGAGVVHSYAIKDDRTLNPSPIQTTNTDKNAHACLIDPTNRFVYVPHTGPNAIYQFLFDATTGKLSPNSPIVVAGGGTPEQPQGPRHYVYHPRLDRLYVVNELDSSVSAYTLDRKTGQLQRFQSLPTLPERWEGKNTCADIHVTPDGNFLYASNRGHDSIAAYRIDEDGLLSFIDTYPTEAVPREFTIDLTGRYLYAAGMRANKLAAYSIDARTGELTRIGTYDTPAAPAWVEAVKLD